MTKYAEHLIPLVQSSRPHKLLSIDGGGIRGVIAIEILAKIEADLRRLSNNPTLLLADYFDFIGGTSTGSIIAAALSLGKSVSEVRDLYNKNGKKMFSRTRSPVQFFFNKYQHKQLQQLLAEEFGANTTLGSDRLKTLFLAVLRNATTDSPWPLTNNPLAKYNVPGPGSNLLFPLWSVIRASTAAPTFFGPESIVINDPKKPMLFVDGGLTPYNNPSFIMFLTATMPEYRIGWQATEKDMLVVSVGTGLHPNSAPDLCPSKMHILHTAKTTPTALMFAALNEQDMLCRVFGKCLVGDVLDSEIGDLLANNGPLENKLFTYCRYNAELTKGKLEEIGFGTHANLPLHKMDAVSLIAPMQEIGHAIAEHRVRDEHFRDFLPVPQYPA